MLLKVRRGLLPTDINDVTSVYTTPRSLLLFSRRLPYRLARWSQLTTGD